MDIQTMNCSGLLKNFGSVITEKLPKPNSPFWDLEDIGDLYYYPGGLEGGEARFIIYYGAPEEVDLCVGAQGFMCLGCEPGSGPRPFIVVGVDNKNQELKLIFPYVYIIETQSDKVMLKIGNDATKYIYSGNSLDEIRENVVELDPEIMETQVSDYIVQTINYPRFLKEESYISICFGSFGNGGLPRKGKVEYEFAW